MMTFSPPSNLPSNPSFHLPLPSSLRCGDVIDTTDQGVVSYDMGRLSFSPSPMWEGMLSAVLDVDAGELYLTGDRARSMPELLMPGAMGLLARLRSMTAGARASGVGGVEDEENHHNDNHNHNHNHNSSMDNKNFSNVVRREISSHIASLLAQCAHATEPLQQARPSTDPQLSPGWRLLSPLAAPPPTSPNDPSNQSFGAPLSPIAGQRQGLGQGQGLARALVRSLPSSPSRSMSLHHTPTPASSSASAAALSLSSSSQGPPPASFQERLSSNLQKLMRSPSPELFRQNSSHPSTSTPHPPAHSDTLSPLRNGGATNTLSVDGCDDSCRSPSWSQSFLRSVSGTRARSHSPSGHSSSHSQQQQQHQQQQSSFFNQQQQQRGVNVHGSVPFNSFACCSSCSVVHVSRAMSVISQIPQSNLTAPSQIFQSKIMHASQSAMSAIIAGCPAALIPSSSSSSPSFAVPPSLSFLQRVAATQVRANQHPTLTTDFTTAAAAAAAAAAVLTCVY